MGTLSQLQKSSNNSLVVMAILVNAVPLFLTSEVELSAFLMFT